MMPHWPEFHAPAWLPYFLLGGVGFLIIVIPLKILWEATRSRRDRSQKIEKFLDRLRERFNEVAFQRGFIGPSRITFKHDGRKCAIWIADLDELVVELDENCACPFPLVVKTKSRWTPGWAFVGLRALPHFPTHDTMIDDAVAIYATGTFGGYLHERILDGITLEGKITGVADSLIVLRRAPGVKWFRLTMTPGGPMRLRIRMHTEDLLFRPDEFESVVHHLQALYDAFVGY